MPSKNALYLSPMMSSQDKALAILLKKYEEGLKKNSRWSKRAFAKRLGMSPGALSEVLRQKRDLSLRLKRKLASKLDLSPREEVDFFAVHLPSDSRQSSLTFEELSEDQFHLISDWWHYAILNLVKTKDFQASPRWIAARLGLPTKQIVAAWERLFRLGHLQWKGTKVVRRHPRLTTTDELLSRSVQKAHLEDAKLIEKSLLHVPLHYRDHTAMTLVMNKKDIARAKELIRLFQDKFAQEIHTEPGEEVYKLSVSFFPLSTIAGDSV